MLTRHERPAVHVGYKLPLGTAVRHIVAIVVAAVSMVTIGTGIIRIRGGFPTSDLMDIKILNIQVLEKLIEFTIQLLNRAEIDCRSKMYIRRLTGTYIIVSAALFKWM